jgi:predicted transcriptional regulator
MEASGHTRRALAQAMRSEGTSIPTIARLFGVTHQRISNILNHPAAAPSVLHDPDGQSAGEQAQEPTRAGRAERA